MLGPFSNKYQSIASKQWADMSNEEVNYIWKTNMVTGLGTVIVFGLMAFGFGTMVAVLEGITWWGWIFTPFVLLMLVSHLRERQQGNRMCRLEKIEAVERIQAIRREPLP